MAVRRGSSSSALVIGALLLTLAATYPTLVVLAHEWSVAMVATPLIIELPYIAVGCLIARRQPGNAVGWIILTAGGLPLLGGDCDLYAWIVYGPRSRGWPLGELAVFLSIGGFFIFGLVPLALLLFPQGRLPPGRWRWALWLNVATVAIWIASTVAVAALDILEHGIHRVSEPGGGTVDIAVNTPTGWFAVVLDVVAPLIALCWLLAAVRLVASWRGSSGASRQQLKCLVAGISICFLAGAILVSGTANGGSALPAQVWSQVPWICFAALPIGIAVGILRYRLFEIDRLISRTISYALLTATLIAVFLGIVGLTTRVLPFSSPIAVAASTLAAAALFNPLRLRVQRVVDHRFNRARYDAEAIVAVFTARLQDAVELDSVRDALLSAVHTVQPAHASVWIKPPSSPDR